MVWTDKKYISCPVCGHLLVKFQGFGSVDATCRKCGSETTVQMDEESHIFLETRGLNAGVDPAYVKVSVPRKRQTA
jgi:phage FluMu protein Com